MVSSVKQKSAVVNIVVYLLPLRCFSKLGYVSRSKWKMWTDYIDSKKYEFW